MGWAPLLGWSYTKQRWRGKILDQAEFNHWLATLQENLPTIRDFYLQMYITSFLLVSGGEADREVTKTLRFLPWLSWHAIITSILGLLRPFVSPYLYHEQTWLNLHFRVPLIIGRTNQRLGRNRRPTPWSLMAFPARLHCYTLGPLGPRLSVHISSLRNWWWPKKVVWCGKHVDKPYMARFYHDWGRLFEEE